MSAGQRVLITGANGYLGAQMSLHLSALGYRITAWCFPEVPSDARWCSAMEEVVTGSIADRELIDKLAEKRFDAVIHLVSLDHHQSQKARPEEALNINVQPCWMLLDAFIHKGLKTFLFFSTIHVYGALQPVLVGEGHPLNPGNVYAMTHELSERICAYYNQTTDANVLTVRLSNSYGHPVFPENNCWWLAVNDLCRTAYYEQKIKLLSDGSPQRDFIHGSDVCQAVACLLNQPVQKGESPVFHISSSYTLTLLELAGLVRDVFEKRYNKQIPVYLPDGSAVEDFTVFASNPRYTISNEKLMSKGFSPKCTLEEGIEQLFMYFEKQEIHA